MTGDPVALGLLAFLTLLFLSLVPAFVGAVFATKGLGFQPLPVWPLNVVLPLLGLFALWSGFGQGHWFTLGFLGLATGVLALQYLLPKRWIDGKVHGVWYGPLAVKSVDTSGGKTILVLALGYKLEVPSLPRNQALLAQIAASD